MNPTSLLFLFFNTSEEGHTMELMDWIGGGILYFNRTGKLPPIPEIEGPKPLYAGFLTGLSFVRNQIGAKVGEMPKGSAIEIWEEAEDIAGYKDRVVIDPPSAGIRRNIFAGNVRKLG